MKRGIVLLALVLAVCLSCSAPQEHGYYTYTCFALDTVVEFRFARDGYAEEYLGWTAEVCQEILRRYEKVFSRTLDDSELKEVNNSCGKPVAVSDDMLSLLSPAMSASELTDGAYDPTLGALSSLWNITGGGPVPTDDEIKGILSHCGIEYVTVDGNNVTLTDGYVMLDFGGSAKGFIAQKIIEYLESSHIEYGLVSLGGNVAVFGAKPSDTDDDDDDDDDDADDADGANKTDGAKTERFEIGVRSPDDASATIGSFLIDSGFVSVSGDYERFFEKDGVRYHHILDSATGYPADSGVRSAAVWCGDGTMADILSTALFVMGTDKALDFYESGKVEFEAVFVTSDGSLVLTPGLNDGSWVTKQ